MHFLDSISKTSNDRLIQSIRDGCQLKVTVDNIDGRMIANQVGLSLSPLLRCPIFKHNFSFQVRLGSGNRDFHYTHWTVYPDRFVDAEFEDLSTEPVGHPGANPPRASFLCSDSENESMRYYISTFQYDFELESDL